MLEENTTQQSMNYQTALSQVMALKVLTEQQANELAMQLQIKNLNRNLQPVIEALESTNQQLREATVQVQQQWADKEVDPSLVATLNTIPRTVFPKVQITLINGYRSEISRLLLVIQQIRAKNETAEEALSLAKITVTLCERLQQSIDNYANEQPEELSVIQPMQQSSHHLKVLVHLGIGLQYDLRQESTLANQHFEIAWNAAQHNISLAETDRALLLFSLLSHDKPELVNQVKAAITQYCHAEQLPLQLLMYQKRGAELLQKHQFEGARQAYKKALHLAELNTNLLNIGYSQLAMGHTFVAEFEQHHRIYSQAITLRATQDQLLQQAFLSLLQGLNDLATQSNKMLASSASDERWVKQTYHDLDIISQYYTEWAKKTADLEEKKGWLEKAMDVRETLVDFFSLLKRMKREYLESSLLVSHQSTKQLSSVAVLEKDNAVQIVKLKAGLSIIEKQTQQAAEKALQEQAQFEELQQQRETYYEQFKRELEEQEKIQQKALVEKAQQQRQKSNEALARLVKVSTTPSLTQQEKSKNAAQKENSVASTIPASQSQQCYETGCQLLLQGNPTEAEKAYQAALAQATEQEALIKAQAYCGIADCYNQQAQGLLKDKQLPQALSLFRKATQQAVKALELVNRLIALKRRGKKITESLSTLQSICDAIEIVVDSTQQVVKQTEIYWAKRYLVLKSARDRAFTQVTAKKGLAYWYRNKKLEERSPAATELLTCSQYHQEAVLTEETIATAQTIAQHLRTVTHSLQWMQYDLKTAERLTACQQQLAEVETAFSLPIVPTLPSINQWLAVALESGKQKEEQEEIKQASNPLLLKGIITTTAAPLLTKVGSINLPQTIVEILAQLQRASYDAYVVGGSVRDLLIGKSPKDFDLITTAPLEVLKDLFKPGQVSHHITHLFKLIQNTLHVDIMVLSELNLEADAVKRDFTVNALYADAKGQVFDPLGKGLNHLKLKSIAFIAEPNSSVNEDPLRLMRLVHLMVETNWELSLPLKMLTTQFAPSIMSCETGRLRFECRKHFLQGNAVSHYLALEQLGLFKALFPSAAAYIAQEVIGEHYQHWLLAQLQSTDERVKAGKPVSLDYVFAVFEVGYLFFHYPQLHVDIAALSEVSLLLKTNASIWYHQPEKVKEEHLTYDNAWIQYLANDYFDYQKPIEKKQLTL